MTNIVRGRRILVIVLLACGLPAQSAGADAYRLNFELRLRADNPLADASIELAQDEHLLREARFRAPAERFGNFRGDGDIERNGDFVTWVPPERGGKIRFFANLVLPSTNGYFDSLVTPDWALFRADDAFPAARVRQRKGARSSSRLRFTLPDGWSLATPFAAGPAGNYLIDNPDRAFDRPTGWLITGKLGRRTDTISGIKVSVAAPINAGVERIGILALLRWTLPYLARETDQLPERLSIVSAGDPMWRGGLSASNSIYLHADRPLLSENGTSTLLHEVVHVLLPVPTEREQDWIDEGLAEYVTLRLLRDSGTISPRRFQKAIEGFAARGRAAARDLATKDANGAVRARAVAVFAELDAELAALTDDEADIYDLVRRIRESGVPLSTERLRDFALALTGAKRIDSLQINLTK
jgi:hypothetical protein